MITQSDTARSGVVVRRYLAATYASALDAYEADLASMAEAGYYPVGHSWGIDAGGPGAPGFGTLAVTYRWDGWAVAERQVATGDAAAAGGAGGGGAPPGGDPGFGG